MNTVFSPAELQRYDRHIILPEIGIEGQLKLKEAKVLVIGAGGLGSAVLPYLTAAGVGNIGIIDDDIVELSNLQRQVLYTNNDIGFSKAKKAKDHLSNMNPETNFNVYNFRLEKENAEKIISEYDIVIDCPDNYNTRYLVSDICEKLNIPHIYGSISRFEGQVSVFNYKNGPTYRDLFPEPPEINENDKGRLGVIGYLPGIIGSIQTCEAIKIITDIGNILSGKLFLMDTLRMKTEIITFG